MAETEKRLWLIDAAYMLKAQNGVAKGYHFDYKKLRAKLEESAPLWRAYYLNSTPNPPTDEQNSFHSWLRSAPPTGPKIITKLYKLKQVRADYAFCQTCGKRVKLSCDAGKGHRIIKEQQKGVDVGIATLALTHMGEYGTLLLSTGDGDLLDAVEFLSERAKRVELVVFRYSGSSGVSTDLQSRADNIYWIDDFADDVTRDEATPDAQPEDETVKAQQEDESDAQ